MKIANIDLGFEPVLLAPMEDVTDMPYRIICRKLGADMVYSEFISSEGLIRDAHKSLVKLEFAEKERPFGIQIFGHDTDSMIKATRMAENTNPDVIDINWGCPVKKVINKGAGAGMLQDIDKMVEITTAVVKATKLAVTAKTRLGWDESSKNIVEIAERLQGTGIKALTIHGRTRAQLYKGNADWTLIGDVKNNPRMSIPIIGNGDITGGEIAREMFDKYGVDGIMVGRAATGNPWIFKEIKQFLQDGSLPDPPGILEKTKTCKWQLEEGIEAKGEKKAIFEMRKFYSNYFKGLPHFKEIKLKLLTSEDKAEIDSILDRIAEIYA